jgi:hypothetical protein
VAPPPAPDAGATAEVPPAPSSRLFGSHPTRYPADTIRPTGDGAALDAAVAAFYDRWKAAYLTRGCDGAYVKAQAGTGATSRITGSQMHGLGMLALVVMAGHDPEARELFDGMFAVSRKVTSYLDGRRNRNGNDNLMGYGINANCMGLMDGDAQTDGDLAIAQALLMADKQWGSGAAKDYLGQAKQTLLAIKAYEMNPRSKTPLLGDWCSLPDEPAIYQNATSPGAFALDHFRSFAAASGDPFWQETLDAVYALAGTFQMRHSPESGLLPAYILNTTSQPAPPPGAFLSEPNGGAFTPPTVLSVLRFAADYMVSGDARARLALTRTNMWIRDLTASDPQKVVNGYRLVGTSYGTTAGPEFEAVFATAAMLDPAGQPWLDALWKRVAEGPLTNAFADTVRLHSLIVLSGNHWIP